jgi:hypothetical protein
MEAEHRYLSTSSHGFTTQETIIDVFVLAFPRVVNLIVLQMSVSTVSTKHLARSDTPSSILSSDSDIRFTRKLGAHYRCGCCILAGFLLFLLVAAAAVYLGCKSFLHLYKIRCKWETNIRKTAYSRKWGRGSRIIVIRRRVAPLEFLIQWSLGLRCHRLTIRLP